MEEEFYKDEFEQFLQQQANNHRMFPTDGVWPGIYKKLHGHKKWPGLTIAAFTILAATIALSVYFSPKPSIFIIDQPVKNNTVTTYKKPNVLLNLVSTEVNNVKGKNFVEQTPGDVKVDRQNEIIPATDNDLVLALNDTKNTSSTSETLKFLRQPTNSIIPTGVQIIDRSVLKNDLEGSLLADEQMIIANKEEFQDEENVYSLNLSQTAVASSKKTLPGNSSIVNTKGDPDDRNVADNFLAQHKADLTDFTTTKINSQKNKFSYSVYITPSISYRKLKEDKNLNSKSYSLTGPVAPNFVTDVNRLVRHKPGTGMEAGLAFTYHLSNTFGIKSGMQFNVRQYAIEAYKSSTELTSIALLSNAGIDTINTLAIYRNNNGNFSTELINRYYQLSIPIGIVWEVLGNKKVQFNVAANIQPTYTFNSNSYMLSTNFKNYAVNSGMLRNWTINSNIETFISLNVGEYKWQLGPQIRYQHLPTYITKYPIRENLMDYGFKIGVTKPIK